MVHPSFGGAGGGLWYLTLFAAEEIPAAIVTYVALLMLLQLGMAPWVATLLSALLFVPWVLKSFMRSWVERVGNFKQVLHLIEFLLFISLILLAFSFRTVNGQWIVFLALFLVSLLCAWHELAARMYYEQMLRPAFQRLLTAPKLACSQVAVIFTYGALIFLVGTLQVYFRQMIRFSWQVGCYVAAGLFLIFMFLHLMTLAPSPLPLWGSASEAKEEAACTLPQRGQLPVGSGAIGERKRRREWRGLPLLILFLLLLPQGLMFHARVLYLYMPHASGGLGCSIQEIGFAQGTVGVIAFSIGLFMNRKTPSNSPLKGEKQHSTTINKKSPFKGDLEGPHFSLSTFSLVLSPFVYLGMTIWPPESLWQLCLCTMTAQLLFGLGLGVCRLPISAISGARYRNTINMLQIPLVSAALFLPMAISGWLVEQLGFDTYFLINALCAPICLLSVYLLRAFR